MNKKSFFKEIAYMALLFASSFALASSSIALNSLGVEAKMKAGHVISDADWVSIGGGSNGSVNALALDGRGNLYAGGDFTIAGGIAANHVAQWNGSAWSALGSGTNGRVYALAFDSSGNMYAGGEFTAAGGIPANHVARWNGGTWNALGSGISHAVLALAADRTGNLYAGGVFTTAGGKSAEAIAKWDGSSWSALGSGMNSWVGALAFDSLGNLFAGGPFDTAGGIAALGVAKWNGIAWSALGSGTDGEVLALAIDGSGNLIDGGNFTIAGGKSSPFIALCNLNGSAVIPNKGADASPSFTTFDARAGLVRFKLQFPAEISYRIYSLSGRELYRSSPLSLGPGSHTLALQTKSLARGAYLVTFNAGYESIKSRLMVCR